MVTADPMAIAELPDEASFKARLQRSGHLKDGWLDLAIDSGGVPVGRIPAGLDTAESVRTWLAAVLPETARLVRERLPARSKSYPAEALAVEIEQLREALFRRS
jgi:hypothetical protein